METNNLVVRQATMDDRGQLIKFYKKVWPGRHEYKYPERFEWLVKKNPYLANFDGIPIWIALINGEIVGHTSAMLVKTLINEKSYPTGMSIDTIVEAKARGLGIGKKLQKINQDCHSVFMALSEIAPINFEIKKKIGGVSGPSVDVYTFIFKIDFENTLQPIFNKTPILKKKVINKIFKLFHIDKLFKYLLDVFYSKKVPLVKKTNLDFREVEYFDNKANEIWDKCKLNYKFAVERTSEYLNWKYVEQPHISYKRYVIQNNNLAVGILIYRNSIPPEPKVGIISELYFIEENYRWQREALIFALNEMEHNGAFSIFFASADRNNENLFKEIGFKKVIKQLPVIHINEVNQPDYSGMKAYISRGEQDWDQFPLAKSIFLRQLIKVTSQ